MRTMKVMKMVRPDAQSKGPLESGWLKNIGENKAAMEDTRPATGWARAAAEVSRIEKVQTGQCRKLVKEHRQIGAVHAIIERARMS